jgi:hypothetical protein
MEENMKTLKSKPVEGATMFALCAVAIVWLSVTGSIATPLEIPRLIALVVLFLVIKYLFMKDISSPTGSGAIVMAIGIFINGAIVHYPFLTELARSFALILFILFLFIAYSYIVDSLRGKVFRMHFENHVGSFAVGTWIAGTSVCGIALCARLPEWKLLVQILVIGNIGLWCYYVFRAVGSFLHFFSAGAWRKVHGVLFLSTVSTQSLVIVWKVAFGASTAYTLVAPWVILLGVIFYCVSFYLIARRYASEGMNVDLDKGWFNTNCITHGAMSITGLVSAVSGVVPPDLTLLIWLWAICWFVIIEIVEIVRAVIRTRLHGLIGGLFIYDPTQWSRNFTFGMLYAFTLNFNIAESIAAGSFLLPLHQAVLHYFAWVVLILLLLEIFIFLRDRLSLFRNELIL